MRRKLVFIVAGALLLALSALGIARAVVPATSVSQHYYANVTTDRSGYAVVDLQVDVNPANVVVKVGNGGTHTGGENPSVASVVFAGFENTDEDLAAEQVRVRVIGWKANVTTGNAIFRYYSNKDARIAVDVYKRTVPPPAP